MDTQKKLVYADDVLKEILKHDPKLSFVIERVKPVDAVEVVHGRWEDHFIEHYAWGRCSNCGIVQYARPRYCPSCGAKMDGGNEDG